MVFIFNLLFCGNYILFVPSVMQIRLLILKTEDPLLVQLSTLVLISFLGGPESSKFLQGLVQRQYRSLAQTTAEISWIQTLLTELKVPFSTPIVFCDNQSAVAIAHNPVLHAWTKHMEIDAYKY